MSYDPASALSEGQRTGNPESCAHRYCENSPEYKVTPPDDGGLVTYRCAACVSLYQRLDGWAVEEVDTDGDEE